mmetsp:Transcript_11111/g.29843  ORF Transcript_11111/g.29843 Transcript_11111/m.29843 type:complete len:302 (+) Transcript_11111:210-1115(+)
MGITARDAAIIGAVAGVCSAAGVLLGNAAVHALLSNAREQVTEQPAAPSVEATESTFSTTKSGRALGDFPKELEKHTLLERKIATALRARAKSPSRSAATRIKSVNALLMKLPKLRAGFEHCRAKFEELDTDGNGSLDLDELTAGCRSFGYVSSEQLLREVFAEADMHNGRTLRFREFLIALALLHLLMSVEELPPEVNAALETMQEAFFFFDESGDGFLQKDEVMIGLMDPEDKKRDRKGSFKIKSDGSANSSALDSLARRFNEMDCDNSGIVTYNEFFYAVESWVGMDDAEDLNASTEL